MTEHDDHSEESTRLRRCIRDLVALTALPAVWMRCDALQTAESLADVLLGMLHLDFVYLSLRGKTKENEIEVGRASGRSRARGQSQAIGEALRPWLNEGSSLPSSLPHPLGDGTVSVTVIRLGPEGKDGVLVAGRREPHFPTEVDRVLLGVGVNQAAVLLQRKEAEEALKESEEQFRLMVESVKDYAIFSLDLEGRVTSWNTGAERLFGYEEAEIVGRSGALVFTPADQAAGVPEEELGRAAETGRGEDERWHQRKDGSQLFVSGVVTSVHGADGTLRGFTKVARDITERKRAEEERERLLAAEQQNSERLRKLADVAARLTVAHDIVSVMGVVTQEVRDLIGAHQSVASLIVNEDWAQAISSVSLSEKYAGWRSSNPRPDGSGLDSLVCRRNQPMRLTQVELERHPAWRGSEGQAKGLLPMRGWLAAPLVGRNGRNLGLVQVSDKDHDEFTAEDEAVLVQLARMASVAIENARLYEELRGKDRRKDEFLAMLAHELRNPLSAISGAVRLFQTETVEEEDFAWGKDVIARQVKQLTGIIDDLLDVSRITQGKIQLRREDIDLRPIIDHAVEVVSPLVEERKHELTISFPKGSARLHADPTRVEQILINLLTNAAKYTESGGRIVLTAESEGAEVLISVRDNGMGIPPEMLPGMFELFAQGDRSLARSEGGLGIGLTLVRKLVEMHGGRIAAQSEGPGMGSEFTVRLPSAVQEPKTVPRAGMAAPKVVAEGARVLVVDDNVDTARGMTRLLRVYGHDVRTAHSGPEAIVVALAHRPEFVLLDIGLPGMDGYEVAKRLREESTSKDAVIIAVSGYGQEEDHRRTREAGFDHHLVKPIDHDILLSLLVTRSTR